MNILFHINHPAQFHLLKNTLFDLEQAGYKIKIIARQKDVLTQLLDEAELDYINVLPEGKKTNMLSLFISQVKQYLKIKKIAQKFKPELLVGTSFILPFVSRKLNIPFINLVEDDHAVIPFYATITYRFSTIILAPEVCQTGKWKTKKIGYNGYHELAFLHPNHFTPNKKIAQKFLDLSRKNFFIRFTSFTAHHDYGKQGISKDIATEIIDLLSHYGDVHISSEAELPDKFHRYKLKIPTGDIHHLLAHCDLVIGDSQSMAMEAGVLGIPSIRINDYADKISVLEELEHKYKLTVAFQPNKKEEILDKVNEYLTDKDLKSTFTQRKTQLIKDKIDVRQLLTWLLSNYPSSSERLKKDKEYQYRFGGTKELKTESYIKTRKRNFTISPLLIYLCLLMIAYIFPQSKSITLNNYNLLDIRLDHLFHVIALIPIPILIYIKIRKNRFKWSVTLAASFLIAILLEFIHLLVPYRAFTFPDLISNGIGVMIGYLIIYIMKHKKPSKK